MKIILVHGEDYIESRNRLVRFIEVAKKRNLDVLKIIDKSKNIKEVLSADSLFEKQKIVIIEDINLFNKSDFKWIKEKHKSLDTTLVIYHKSTIGKTFINKLPEVAKNEEFMLPKLIWSFLESIYPGNLKNSLILLNKITENDPVEFIFALMSKHFRDMYWVQNDPDSLKYPSWRKGKLKVQAKKFSDGKIKDLISVFSEIDVKSKTSKESLKDLLDFSLITALE